MTEATAKQENDFFPAPPTGHARDENIRDCATSLVVDNPILSRETAEAAVAKLYDKPKSEWQRWSERHPTSWDREVLGRDCLGFVHRATHLSGSRDGMAFEYWLTIVL